jgi:hypothetical protein
MRANGKDVSVLLDRKSKTVDAPADSELLLNLGRKGFYVTLYDKSGYDRLAANFPKLGSHDRAGVLLDLYLFLRADLVLPETYARFVSLCADNPDAITTQVLIDQQLDTLNAIANDSPVVQGLWPRFFPPLIAAFGEDPKPGEPPYVGATRESLTSHFAFVDRQYAQRMAGRFEQYSDLDRDLKAAAAVGYAMTQGKKAEEPLQRMVTKIDSEVERAKIYLGLASFREPELVQDTLDLSMSGKVSRSDSYYTLVYCSQNPYARGTVWRWLSKNYDALWELYAGSEQFYIGMTHVIPLCGVGHEAEVRRFLSGRRMKNGGSGLTRTLELLHINERLRKRLIRPGN